MIKITIEQLQLARIGIIRENMLKKTLTGKIYKARILYKDKEICVKVLYKRNGKGIILGPYDSDLRTVTEYRDCITSILQIQPAPDLKTIPILKIAIGITLAVNYFNVLTPPKNLMEVRLVMIDKFALVFLIVLYIVERRRYDDTE